MPTLVSKLLRKPRDHRARRRLPMSSFTVFLLGFGLFFWLVVTFSIVTQTNCGMSYFWTTGWESKTSIFQLLMLALVLIIIVWSVRLSSVVKRGMLFEAAFQGVLITGIIVAFVGFRALLFPYGVPSYTELFSVYERITRPHVRFKEERVQVIDRTYNRKYDYPPPPDVEFVSDPRFEPGFYLDFAEIFSRSSSPWPSEIKAARACMIEEKRAYAQYLEDRESLDEYWEGFRNWHALNKHRIERRE